MKPRSLDQMVHSVLPRCNFGVVYPEAMEPCAMTTECLVEIPKRNSDPSVALRVRFLQVEPGSPVRLPAQREVGALIRLSQSDGCVLPFKFGILQGSLAITVIQLQKQLFKLRAHIANRTPFDWGDDVMPLSFMRTNTILSACGGQFVSLLEPPAQYAAAAAACRNMGTWPVLMGKEPERISMLSSPIVLSDYPRMAPSHPRPYVPDRRKDPASSHLVERLA
jgi:hypothetical protein